MEDQEIHKARSYDRDDSRQIREGSQSTRCSGCGGVFSDTNFGRHKESSAHRDRMLELGYHLEPRGMWQCQYLECAPASPARQGRNPGSCSRQDTMKRHYVLKHGLLGEEALKLAKCSTVCVDPSPLLSPSNSGEDHAIPAEVIDESCGLYGLGNVGVVRADDAGPDATDPYHIIVEGPKNIYGPYRENATLSPEFPRSPPRPHIDPALLSPGLAGPGRLRHDVPDRNVGVYSLSPHTDVSSLGSLSPVSVDHPLLTSGSPASLGKSSVDWDSQSIESRSVLLSTTGDGQHLLPSALDGTSGYCQGIAYPYHHGIDGLSSTSSPQLRQPEDGSASLFVPASLTTDGLHMNNGFFVPTNVLQQALASHYQHMYTHASNEHMLTHLSLNSPHSQPQHDDVFLTGFQ